MYQLPEEIELVWDDTVAPETAIDMESPHVSTHLMLSSIAAVIAAFSCVIGVISWIDPVKNSPVALRKHVIPFDGLKSELGLMKEEDVEQLKGQN